MCVDFLRRPFSGWPSSIHEAASAGENPQMAIEKKAELRLGSVDGRMGRLEAAVVIDENGAGHVRLSLFDPRSRRDGEFILLDRRGLDELRELITHIDETVVRLGATGQIARLQLPF